MDPFQCNESIFDETDQRILRQIAIRECIINVMRYSLGKATRLVHIGRVPSERFFQDNDWSIIVSKLTPRGEIYNEIPVAWFFRYQPPPTKEPLYVAALNRLNNALKNVRRYDFPGDVLYETRPIRRSE